MALHKLMSAIVRALDSLLLNICLALMFLSVAVLSLDILLRIFFQSSLVGAHELVTLSFTAVFLLGAGVLYIRNEDVAFTILVGRLPRRYADILAVLVYAAGAVSMGTLSYHAALLIAAQRALTTAALGLPLYLRMLPVMIACMVIALAMATQALVPLNRLIKGDFSKEA